MKIKNNLGQEIVIPKHQESIIKHYIDKGNHDIISNIFMNTSGHQQLMMPGHDYSYYGKSVTEYPMIAQKGTTANKERAERLYKQIAPSSFIDVSNYVNYATGKNRDWYADPRSEEAWKMYLGLNDKPKYIAESKYKNENPAAKFAPNTKFYKIDQEAENQLVDYFKDKLKPGQHLTVSERELESLDNIDKKSGYGPFALFQNFNVGKGQDKQGEYIYYNDTYDFPGPMQMMLKGNPYEFYNKIYLPKGKSKEDFDESYYPNKMMEESMKGWWQKEKGGKIKAQKGVVAESTGVNKIIPEQQFVTNKQALQQLFAQQQAIQKNSTVKKTKEQGKIAKAWDVASHPATAIRALNTQGYIPQNLGKGETAPLDYAFDIVNPAFYANAIGRTAKNIVTPQTYTDIPKTLGYLLQKASGEHISPDLQQAAYSTLGKAMDASIAIPVFGEIAGDLKNLNVYKHLPEDATISTMGISNEGNPYIHNKKQILIKDLESDINEKLLKGYGINKKGTNLSVKLQRTPKISAEGTDFEFIVKENNKKIGTIGLNKKSGGIEGGKVGTYYEKDADYPYAWADEESYKGSGVSGEINKAITDVLQESKLGHLYSSGSHTPEGLKRWKNLVRKGKAEKIGKETYRLLEKGGTIKVLKEKTVNGKKHYLIDTKD